MESKTDSENEVALVRAGDDTSVTGWSEQEALTNNDPKIVLMGDSVLDCFFWLHDPKQHLRVQIQQLLRAEPKTSSPSENQEHLSRFRCVNLAVDQMTTYDFLRRTPTRNGWGQYSISRAQTGFPDAQDRQYFAAADGNMYSVENLRRLRNVRAVVISIGGNDVYLRADIQRELIASMMPFQGWRRDAVADRFARIATIFKYVREAAPTALIVPVIVYHPHYDLSVLGGALTQDTCTGTLATQLPKWTLSSLVTPMAKQVLTLARAQKLPVIDLSHTFDPNNECHYGTGSKRLPFWSGAEPSVASAGFIARLIIDVVRRCLPLQHPPQSDVFWGLVSGNDWVRSVRISNTVAFANGYRFAGQLD